MNLTPQQLDAFWSKVDVRGEDECWCWIAGTQSKGYGSFWISGKSYNAHRVSFMIANGYMPTLLVLHSCDVRRCVNPKHLREGTQLDNVQDMMDRGRANLTGLKYAGQYYR